MTLHLRQIALVARELEPVVEDLCAVLDVEVCFRDPGVAEFGLRNALMLLGDTFLEVVSPVRADATAARYLARQGGDGGYMVILQSDDLARERTRLGALGVRVVWEIALPDIATIHLHPKDLPGAIVSLDEPRPGDAWRWGGPRWREQAASKRVGRLLGASLQAGDPARLAARWGEVLGRPVSEERGAAGLEIRLERGGAIRFEASEKSGREGLAALRLEARDPKAILEAARARDCLDANGRVRIGGVRIDLVPAG